MPQQPKSNPPSGWTPVNETAASAPPSGWTPVDENKPGFLSGLYDSVAGGVKALASGFTDKPTEGTLFDKALDAQTAEGGKAVENAKQGRYSEAAGHGLAAVVPGFGPAAAKAGEDIGSGNTSYGLGEAAGLIGQAAAPGITEKIPAGRILKTAVKTGLDAASDVPVVRKIGGIAENWRSTAAKPVYPGAPLPEAPPTEVSQASALYRGASSPPDPAAGLGKIPVRGSIAGAMAKSVEQPTVPFQRGHLQELLNKSLDAAPPPDPKAPIYQRPASGSIAQQMKGPAAPARGSIAESMKTSTDLPEGHTAHDSSALRSSKYDAGANEFHARMTSGDTTYVYGDVAPEEAQAFADADSKGKAYQQIKSSHPLVAKIVNGKRVAVKPGQ